MQGTCGRFCFRGLLEHAEFAAGICRDALRGAEARECLGDAAPGIPRLCDVGANIIEDALARVAGESRQRCLELSDVLFDSGVILSHHGSSFRSAPTCGTMDSQTSANVLSCVLPCSVMV